MRTDGLPDVDAASLKSNPGFSSVIGGDADSILLLFPIFQSIVHFPIYSLKRSRQ
jgi:hypothetical protein